MKALRPLLLVCLFPAISTGQLAEPPKIPGGAGEIALAPSRLEIPLAPGQSRTEVINVISTGDGQSRVRLLASLGDWTLDRAGDIKFSRPGQNRRSATEWMTYSPVEFQVAAGETHPIRVTVDVPAGTPHGDYTAVLFVEERPPDLKPADNRKQIRFHFRLAAILYVQVGTLTRKGSLEALAVETGAGKVTVTPTLKNSGNAHIRPVHSFEILDAAGARVASLAETIPGPVLSNGEFAPPLTVAANLAPGAYTLKYRVDFKDGGKVFEGRKAFTVAPER